MAAKISEVNGNLCQLRVIDVRGDQARDCRDVYQARQRRPPLKAWKSTEKGIRI